MEEYVKELDNLSLEEEDDEDDVVSLITDFGTKIVGLSNELMELRNRMLNVIRPHEFGVFSIVGEAGSGRSNVAMAIFEDLFINNQQFFDCAAWVTVGHKYRPRQIFLSILCQIDGVDKGKLLIISDENDDEKLSEYLHNSLKGRRYMIVLDDLRSALCNQLRRSFPPQNNGSLILLTTSISEIALSAYSYFICELRAFDEQIIWEFIYFNMFVLNSCPVELEEAGRKIAKNCGGLRIPFIKAVLFLCKGEKTLEYWNKIADDGENSVFTVEDEISEAIQLNLPFNISLLHTFLL
ncbi:hypothetical protein C2S52_005208 [Perilla frutescens var. hirtella]|nr:hypothetical protein C2S52_005208 [Perilla frutescens var. hirtella]